MPDLADLDALHPRHKKVVITFHKLREGKTGLKQTALYRQVAKTCDYVIDQNGSNSTVATIIKKWQKKHS